MPDDLIQPKDGAAAPAPAAETPAPAPDESGQASKLPDDLLKLPTIQALMAGSPAAASGSIEEFAKRPEGKIIASNKGPLMSAGFGFYKSLDGSTGVVFNGLYIHGDQIKQADQAGKLQEIAPPFDHIGSAVATSGSAHPALAHDGNVPQEMAVAPVQAVPQMASAPQPPASVENKLTTARLKNVAAGSPTSGGKPGGGRLINSIMRPVQ